MGFDYKWYLTTDWWKNRRKKVIEDRQVCEICGENKDLQVHHLNYKRLWREDDKDLLLLCEKCHNHIHTDENSIPYADFVSKIGGVEFYSNKKYVQISTKNLIPEEFTLTEVGRILKITKYIGKHQILVKDCKFLKDEDIEIEFNISKKQSKRFINKLKEYQILKYVEINGTKCYVFNPLYAMYGNEITYITYEIFKSELKNEVPKETQEVFEFQFKDNMTKVEVKE